MDKNNEYWNDIRKVIASGYAWEKLKGKTLLLTGASGTLGQIIVDVISILNDEKGFGCKIVAVSRNAEKAKAVLNKHFGKKWFKFWKQDVTQSDILNSYPECTCDYILHAASNTHPKQYAEDPVGTITANVFGTYYLLKLAAEYNAEMLLFSSVEIYGENNTGEEAFREQNMGYIDCADMRAGYPESKRLAESMCFSFAQQYDVNFKIVRLARVYGPTMHEDDSKAVAQFIKNAVGHKNIVLKSDGKQIYSFIYSIDAVSGIFAVMLNGKNRMAYNISGTGSVICLKNLAELIAREFQVSVEVHKPDEIEVRGYSKATKAILNNEKLCALGWEEATDIRSGIEKIKRCVQANDIAAQENSG